MGVLSSEISKHSKICPPPSLRSHLTSSPMGVLSGDYDRSKIKLSFFLHVLTILSTPQERRDYAAEMEERRRREVELMKLSFPPGKGESVSA